MHVDRVLLMLLFPSPVTPKITSLYSSTLGKWGNSCKNSGAKCVDKTENVQNVYRVRKNTSSIQLDKT